MGRLLGVLLLALTLSLAGCGPTLYTREPLGEAVALNPEEWRGMWWGTPGGVGAVAVLDADKGIIELSELCKQSPSDSVPVQLRRFSHPDDTLGDSKWAGRWYVMMPVEGTYPWNLLPEKPKGLFTYLRFTYREGTRWLWYSVAVHRFRSLVEKGVLPGRVEGDNVILGRLAPVHYQILVSSEYPVVEWQNPNVLVRLPAELDPCIKDLCTKGTK